MSVIGCPPGELRGWAARFAKGEREHLTSQGSYVRSEALEAPSLIGLRTRAARYWLVGVSLISFAVAYVAPMAYAFTQANHLQAEIPQVALPVVDFPTLKVPELHKAAVAPAYQVPAARPSRVAATPRARALPAVPASSIGHTVAPATAAKATTTTKVPVVEDRHSIAPPSNPATPKQAADPFAKAPVVTDAAGAVPAVATVPVDPAPAAKQTTQTPAEAVAGFDNTGDQSAVSGEDNTAAQAAVAVDDNSANQDSNPATGGADGRQGAIGADPVYSETGAAPATSTSAGSSDNSAASSDTSGSADASGSADTGNTTAGGSTDTAAATAASAPATTTSSSPSAAAPWV